MSIWRDAASKRLAAPQAADVDLAADVFFSNNPSRGGYRGTCTCPVLWHLALVV
jgi:hypothetical protein